MEGQKPIEKIRVGAVTATIWKNTVKKDNKTFENYSIGVSRSYKNKDGEWKETNSYAPSDLPKLGLAIAKAYDFILSKKEVQEEE